MSFFRAFFGMSYYFNTLSNDSGYHLHDRKFLKIFTRNVNLCLLDRKRIQLLLELGHKLWRLSVQTQNIICTFENE